MTFFKKFGQREECITGHVLCNKCNNNEIFAIEESESSVEHIF